MKDEKFNITLGSTTGGTCTTTSETNVKITNHTTIGNVWGNPTFVCANEVGETVEFIYKQKSFFASYLDGPYWFDDIGERVFKIVYSCIDGKWNKSEPIFGTIIPKSEESYEF